MYKIQTNYVVSSKILLDKIMREGLPVNAFIDKGRCAIGGTYLEIMFKQRCSLIVVPNISILINKQTAHPEIDIVYGDIPDNKIREWLLAHKPGHKVMTTPEGMRRFMRVAAEVGRLDEIYKEWFLLLDEAHTFISEAYREDILAPFDYFWDFTNKSIISATPFEFSDPRFKELHYHKITFAEKLGIVQVVNAKSVLGTLNYLLNNIDKYPGNIHIFYNSVTQIVEAIKRAGLKDGIYNIFCADDKEQKNRKKLGELAKYFVAEPTTGNYKKVNFYTCKYFEGWDLFDKNATIVLVTDINRPQTMVGVKSKGKQAIGRLRSGFEKGDEPHQVIHITNHKYLKSMKPLEDFRTDFTKAAKQLIQHWNEHVELRNETNMKLEDNSAIIKYADQDKTTQLATLNLMKLDQQVNEAANNEVYNHIEFILKDWQDGYYDVEYGFVDHKIETSTEIKRKSKADKLKDDYQELKAYHEKEQGTMMFYFGQTPEQEIKSRNPTAYKAYQLLDERTLIDLKYNVKKVDEAIVLKENTLAKLKLDKLLYQQFKVGARYTNVEIKSALQRIYNQLNIRDKNGKIRVATATQLREEGRFEIHPAKKKNNKGVDTPAYQIVRANFNILMAA